MINLETLFKIIYGLLSGTQLVNTVLFIINPHPVFYLPQRILVPVAFSLVGIFCFYKVANFRFLYSIPLGISSAFGCSFIV